MDSSKVTEFSTGLGWNPKSRISQFMLVVVWGEEKNNFQNQVALCFNSWPISCWSCDLGEGFLAVKGRWRLLLNCWRGSYSKHMASHAMCKRHSHDRQHTTLKYLTDTNMTAYDPDSECIFTFMFLLH